MKYICFFYLVLSIIPVIILYDNKKSITSTIELKNHIIIMIIYIKIQQ